MLEKINPVRDAIISLRNQHVILDVDLAKLYDVETKHFNQAVKRNIEKFPEDFMFKLTQEEKDELVTNCDRLANLKHSSSVPTAFTELGVIQAAGILKSSVAVRMSIFIARTFVAMMKELEAQKVNRQFLLALPPQLESRLDEIEKRIEGNQGKISSQNRQFDIVVNMLQELAQVLDDNTKPPPRNPIGF
ncbi:ORF6N domain-containing protein [Microscilla marina]|uniref:KilA-N DNA-binding domain-containing protein n=1 Tax=Microscilla marina ATCC 23134 TaxID=313606 RepID=A1ZKK6_MICM2|nr:ORF6N domain-containing protein [Microscilla marina]EAY29232.1 conserved hypothetical protein [Microscilla marina ATCC 23134]